MDSIGNVKIEPQYYEVEDFSCGLALVDLINISAEQIFINKSGEIAFKPQTYTWSFSEGLAKSKIDNKIVFYNLKGEITIKTDYLYGDSFKNGLAKIWDKDSTKYIDKTGKEIIKLSGIGHSPFSEDIAIVRKNFNVLINKKGKIVVDTPSLDGVLFDFSEGLAQITYAGESLSSGFVDTKGEIIVPMEYNSTDKFNGGYAAFKKNNKWGFFNTKGEIVIPPIFDNIDHEYGFKYGLCWAKKDKVRGYINNLGNFIWIQNDNYLYEPIDTLNWKLDTLNAESFLFLNQSISNNYPHKIQSDSSSIIQLKVVPELLTPYENKYFGLKIFLINGSKDSLNIHTQDENIKLYQQVKVNDGKWVTLENKSSILCISSISHFLLLPKNYIVFATPILKGDINSKFRIVLHINNKLKIYSNEFEGCFSSTILKENLSD
ncbi:WG repeat-containing protein (plasmid) [Chondrinema litorale]|nr:WG repeat-containing protein [Chondrinema litorale]UZR96754.1 WG repeat-containing protein [Chondrinema litorale]